ncbi:MAG: trimethylamine methyltransferase family protein [Gemmatimonadota bacterium]
MKQLSDGQVVQLQAAAERLLGETGFRLQHPELLARARRAGAAVEEASGRVRLPAPLLGELLSQAPREYTIAGAGGFARQVGAGARQCLAIVTDPWILDYGTGRLRHPGLADVRRHTRIAQRLDEVAAISLMDYPVTDVAGPDSNLHALETCLLNHSKHIYVLAASEESLARYLELGDLLRAAGTPAGPLMTAGVAVLSPLTLTGMNAGLLQTACARGLPVVPTVCPMAGSTGPYSKVGTLLLGHAENLFMAALTQILQPGHPFLYAFGPSITDMRRGEDLYYTLDKVTWKLAGARLARHCGLPSSAECGGAMSCGYDPQAGAEGALFMAAAWESGAEVLAGIGSCCNAVGMSAEHMILQTAWLAAARHLGRGLGDGLEAALRSIGRVGPGGQFMDDELTLERLRSDEFFRHELFGYGEEGGSMLARAHARAEELGAGEDSPLPTGVEEEIRRYFRDEYGRPAP